MVWWPKWVVHTNNTCQAHNEINSVTRGHRGGSRRNSHYRYSIENNKASDFSELTVEFIKYEVVTLICSIHRIICNIWNNEPVIYVYTCIKVSTRRIMLYVWSVRSHRPPRAHQLYYSHEMKHIYNITPIFTSTPTPLHPYSSLFMCRAYT